MKAAKSKHAKTGIAVGDAVFIRTATYHYTGRIVALSDTFITLNNAAWISDSGRYHVAFVSGFDSNAEIEPYPSNLHVHIAIGAIVDIAEWPHELPLIAQ